jgi:hypothetical protein
MVGPLIIVLTTDRITAPEIVRAATGSRELRDAFR